jgi:prepilin-type processing-associated H-X9-DG protein
MTVDPVSGEQFIYLGAGQQLNHLPTTSVLAYSPTDKNNRAVLFVDGHVELADRKHFSELTNRGVFELALADLPARRRPAEAPATPPPAAAPAEPLPSPATEVAAGETRTVATGLDKPGLDREKSKGDDLGVELAGKAGESPAIFGAQTVSFVRSDIAPGIQYRLKNEEGSGQAVPVLALFQVMQNGSEIQVVDGDGSIYRGQLLPGGSTFQTGTAAERERLTTNESQSLLTSAATAQKTPAPSRQFEEQDVWAGKSAEPAAQNYSFRVTGTNQTLKQSVVFAGNFLVRNVTFAGAALAITNGTPGGSSGNSGGGGGGGGGGGAQPAPESLTQPRSLLNARISGTAVVGGTNQIEINAVPAEP